MHYKNNMMHGVFTEWTEDGRLTKDITYDNGIPYLNIWLFIMVMDTLK